MSPTQRPAYGQRLMPSVLDDLATTDPSRLYAVVPAKSEDINEGFFDITVADIARCTNFMANWIRTTLGTSQNHGTISYIGIADLRGAVVFLAAVKCGYKVYLHEPQDWSLFDYILI